jgi:hypothetical protein
MKRASALVLVAAAATAPSFAASSSAPADEYFGPFKYSAISIRSKIGALGRAYTARWIDDGSVLHDAGLLESSYKVWAQRYPRDPWLAPTGLHLAQLYMDVQTPQAQTKSRAMFQYVAQTFPATKEGRVARLRMQQGLPKLHAERAVNPTPNPYARPAAPFAASAAPAAASAAPAPTAATPSPKP